MNILILRLQFPQAIPHCSAVVQEGVDQDRRGKHECDEVRHGVGCGQVQGGVLVVRRDIQRHIGCDDAVDVVRSGEPIPSGIRCQREVTSLPDLKAQINENQYANTEPFESSTYVLVVDDRHQNPVEEYKSDEDVHFCPPGNHERGSDVGDLVPVKVEDAHAETRGSTEQLVDDDIVRDNPANERKVRETGEEESYRLGISVEPPSLDHTH